MLRQSAPEGMKQAGRMLNRGDTEGAFDIFTVVHDGYETIGDIFGMVDAEHMRGVCLRMLSRYKEAEAAFGAAFNAAEGRVKKGHILRDWCMVPLEMENFERATELIDNSLELLEEDTDRPEVDEEKRKTEYLASLGFQCRVQARKGELASARVGYAKARKGLRGRSDTYELNTTVAEMRDVSSFRERVVLAPRALCLSAKAGHVKRIIQITLLVVCRPLERRASKH